MIVRKVHQSHYTVIDNVPLRDKTLSFRATGLLCYLLSLPDDWKISGKQLSSAKTDGRDSVFAALKELEVAGYVKREKINDEKGRLVNLCHVSEIPHNFEKENIKDGVSPVPACPDTVRPVTVKPDALEVLSLRSTVLPSTESTKKRPPLPPNAASSSSEEGKSKANPSSSKFQSLPDWHNPSLAWARQIADETVGKVTTTPTRNYIERIMLVCIKTNASTKLAASPEDITEAMRWWVEERKPKTVAYIEESWANTADTESHPVGKWFLLKRGVETDEKTIAKSRIENHNLAVKMSEELASHGIVPELQHIDRYAALRESFRQGQKARARRILDRDTILSRIPDMVDKRIPDAKELRSWRQ